MTRNWEEIFQHTQPLSPRAIAMLQELEAEIASLESDAVLSVAAEDGSIVVDGTAADPTIRTGTLDAIAAAHPPAAAWSNNSKRITSLADPSNAQDADTKAARDAAIAAATPDIAAVIHAATSKTTPADADELGLVDSAASNVLKKLTWASLKATLKTYFDTLYPSGSGTSTGTNTGDVAFATNAVVLGTAAAAGGASTVMRSNDTIAAFDATSPTTQAFGDAAAVGSAAVAARRDHKHAFPSLGTGSTNACAGNDSRLSDSRAPSGSAGGDLTGTYPNPTLATAGGGAAGPTGSATVTPIVTVDAKGRVTALSSATTVPTNAAGGDLTGNYPNPTLGSGAFATPAVVLGSAAAAGSGTDAIRADSTIAAFDTTAPVTQAFGDAAAVGTAAFAARRDHTHGMPASPAGGLAVYGDGSDGTVTFDGTTTILGVAPSPSGASGVYTQNRDWFFAAMTLNSGITIIPNGFRIFCQGALTNNGSIKHNGTSVGNSATGALGLSNGNSTLNSSVGSATKISTGDGNGGTAGGTVGTTGTGISLGGGGGAGGTGTSGAGGSGGSMTALTVLQGTFRAAPVAILGHSLAGTSAWKAQQGGGGGGGGGGSTTASGGGGGSGGGIVLIAAKTFAGTGAIQARGGDGGTRTTGSVGGGGGGGGGVVIVVSSSVSAGAISGQTVDANGGARGLKVGGGTEDAVGGTNGTVILIPN